MDKICDCCGKWTLEGFQEKREPKNWICHECEAIYQKVKTLKSERDLLDDKPVFVVYATKNLAEHVWIEGIYMDSMEGGKHLEEMENSDDFGHLCWSNKLMKVRK